MVDETMVDYGYIEYYRKSWENSTDPEHKKKAFKAMLTHEAKRDFFTISLRQINHLIQIGPPNFELKEPRCEMYKISLSFWPGSEFKH